MEKRLDCKDVGLDCDDMVCPLPGEEVIHKMDGPILLERGAEEIRREHDDDMCLLRQIHHRRRNKK